MSPMYKRIFRLKLYLRGYCENIKFQIWALNLQSLRALKISKGLSFFYAIIFEGTIH